MDLKREVIWSERGTHLGGPLELEGGNEDKQVEVGDEDSEINGEDGLLLADGGQSVPE